MQLRLSDPAREYQQVKTAVDRAVLSVLESGQYVLDANVSKLEAAFAEFCGATHAVGTASGTTALMVGLRAAGIHYGSLHLQVYHGRHLFSRGYRALRRHQREYVNP